MVATFKSSENTESLLLVLPLVLHEKRNQLFIESQAGNGLTQWLVHFKYITLVAKTLSIDTLPGDSVAIEALGLGNKLSVVQFPTAWTAASFLRSYPEMRSRLVKLIDDHDYLHFAIGGAWGDWGAIGAMIAAKRGRMPAVWTDRVESEVMLIDSKRFKGIKRFKRWIDSRIAMHLERFVISRAVLGLFHGKDTFDAYRSFSRLPFLVHDIHLKPADRISPCQLAEKINKHSTGPLEIIYVGRVHPDKGVMDWIETLKIASELGVAFNARWLGDGPQIDEARLRVRQLALTDRIAFPGMLSDRAELLDCLRAAHLMLFCHLTPESPRCLVEALVSGTPIVGYRSSYAEDLVAGHGGGILTARQPSVLANALVRLDRHRSEVGSLIESAAKDGYDMNDEAVFAHRAGLIKAHCNPRI